MKTLVLGFFAALSLALALVPSLAHAQVDNVCGLRLEQNDGRIINSAIDRRSVIGLGKNLIIGFDADYFNGQESDSATFMVEDRHDKHVIDSRSKDITYNWDWSFEVQTEYGLLKVHCE